MKYLVFLEQEKCNMDPKLRYNIHMLNLDDDKKETKDLFRLIKDFTPHMLSLKRCNFIQKSTQDNILEKAKLVYINKSFIKFHVKEPWNARQVIINQCTIYSGKSPSIFLPFATRFEIRHSFLNSQDFAWKPLGLDTRELVNLNNDMHGQIRFDILNSINYFRKRFMQLERLEFDGEVCEKSLKELLSNLDVY